MASVPEISVVIPALNEAKNIGPLIERLRTSLNQITHRFEIIIIDGGSTDDTREVAVKLGARCILQRRLGYGGALREGFIHARGDYIITLDCDLSHPPELIGELWNQRTFADIVIGSRFVSGGSSKAPLGRHFLSTILNRVFALALSLPIKDLSSGYRLYRRAVLTPALYRPENFNVLQEVLVRAFADGYSIKEVPLIYEERASGTSHVSLLKFALSYIPTLYRLWRLRNLPSTADYEDKASRSKHVLQRYWIRSRAKYIKSYLDTSKSCIDIGCGSSAFTASMSNSIAFDSSESKLRYQRARDRRCVRGRAESLPFRTGALDQVLASQILGITDDVGAVIREVNRILKLDGTLVIAVTDSRRIGWMIIGALYRLLPNIKGTKINRDFQRHQLVDVLAESGFRALGYRYICGAELILKCQKVEECHDSESLEEGINEDQAFADTHRDAGWAASG